MRSKLIDKLANCWRKAENIYLDHDDDTVKELLADLQNELNLTEKEIQELNDICNSMGL